MLVDATTKGYTSGIFDKHYWWWCIDSLFKERLGVKELILLLMNIYSDGIKNYNDMVGALYGRGSFLTFKRSSILT